MLKKDYSIIAGFITPLKEEHIIFLEKILLPLYQGKSLHLYHNQLTCCIFQYLMKNPSLINMVLLFIIHKSI